MATPGPTWRVSLSVARRARAAVESALESLGGALAIDEPEESSCSRLTLYLDRRPDGAAVARQLARAFPEGAPPPFEIDEVPPIDWVAESQKALPPVTIGPFYLYGRHVAGPPPGDRIPLLVEAGPAFGTGRHGSTQGCLLALAALKAEGWSPIRALDLGCGCGVLALAIARLWAVPVLAVDNDPEAVRVSAENAVANGLADRIATGLGEGYAAPAIRASAPFDLIAANILAEPLCAMAPGLARHLAPGGIAVLSGFLQGQVPDLRLAHRTLEELDCLDVGDWSTLVFKAPL